MAAWAWVAGDWRVGAERELTGATGRSLTVSLTDPSTATFQLFGNDPAAPTITELIDDVWVFRDGEVLFRGRIVDSSDDVEATSHKCSFTATDYRGVLNRRKIPPTGAGNTPTYQALSTKAQETIVWDDLITVTQALPGGNLGIVKAADWPSTGINRAGIIFGDGDSVFEQIRTLGAMSNGFDFDIDATLQAHLYYPHRGTDRGSVLDYGGTVASLRRQVNTSSFANAIRLNGGQSDTVGPYTVTDQVASLGDPTAHPEGRWEASLSEPSVYELAAVQAVAAARLAEVSAAQPTYTFTLTLGAWRGPDHIWVGDWITYTVISGRLDIRNESARVQEIGISVGQDNVETVTVTVGPPRVTADRVLRELSRRLALLARR
jgi:hypothetical protein